jgi:extracellular elastinolytic metalloproteinase
MRCLLTVSLIVASLAGNVLSHKHGDNSVRRRKSLGFGPEHPHAVFRTDGPYRVTNGFMPLHPHPFVVAELFLQELIANELIEYSYYIRDDSYTDSNTGVTHVYVRQLVNGLEVADGDININVKGDEVLSYGNSFYGGPIPMPSAQMEVDSIRHPHREYCEFLTSEVRARTNELSPSQVAMGQHNIAELAHILTSNCRFQNLSDEPSLHSTDVMDFRPALLQFMVVATPNNDVANDILRNFDSHMNKMVVIPTTQFAPPGGAVEFLVDKVPDAVNPVKAKMAYIQLPDAEDMMHLVLVWKFEVEMQDNWYEVAVSAAAPHRIISVVDWASDAPIPDPSQPTVATYNVFAWGVNDPEVGNRTMNKENYDLLASPVGWHSIPFANDPSTPSVPFREEPFFRYTTTTWGNNVFAQENWEGRDSYIDNYRPDAGKDMVFNYTFDAQRAIQGGAFLQVYYHHVG